jgi:hypothetical protein
MKTLQDIETQIITLTTSIEVNYPPEVNLGQEFVFKIKLINFDSGVYDVKIDVLSGGNRIAQILNEDTWQSTYRWIDDVINPNEEKEFSMNITKDFESAEIEIKIRDSSGKSEIFSNYSISKSNETFNPEQNETNQGNETDSEINLNEQLNISNKETGEVILNTNPDAEDTKNENSLEQNKDNYIKYGLIGFCVLLLILFLLKGKIRKKEYKNEFQ